MPQAIDFSGNILKFRFIDIDINVTIPLELSDFLFIPGFNESNAAAHINLPKELFSNLFLYNLTYEDLSNNNFTRMKYAMDTTNWYNNKTTYINNTYIDTAINGSNTLVDVNFGTVLFSNALVDLSNAIIPNSTHQNLKYDYIRFILKEITGQLYMNGLFRNTDALLQNIISMDINFNTQIISILDQCGTISAPMTNETYYFNPCRILVESILALDNVLETDNAERRNILLQNFSSSVNSFYASNANMSYYIHGTQYNTTNFSYYSPIYVNVPSNSLDYTNISFTDTNLSGYNFFTTTNPNVSIDPPELFDYNVSILNKFFPIPFQYGDSLGVRLTYKPKNNLYLGKTIRDYSYEVYTDMGLELVTDVQYVSTTIDPNIEITTITSDIPRNFVSNNISTIFEYVFTNTNLVDLYNSPVNYYPTLENISNIQFEKLVEDNWLFSIFTRPRNFGSSSENGVGYDRFNSVPDTTNTTLNLTNLLWINQNKVTCSWQNLLKTTIEPTVTPYGPIKTNADQQIMIMTFGTNTISDGTIKNVRVDFKDGRIIRMV